jgi:hypothetical protein
MIRKEKSKKMQKYIKNFIIPYLYEAQHVSGDIPPVIKSLKLHWQPLVLYTWKVVRRVVGGRCEAHCAWQRLTNTRPTTFQVWKTRGYQCSFRLLMMGSVSPETCWVSYKYGIIKILIHFCTLLDFSLRIVLWWTDPRTEGFDISHTIRLTILQFVCHCITTYNFTYALLSFLCKRPWRWKETY